MKIKRIFKIIISVIILLFIFLLASYQAGEFLVVLEEDKKVDVIIVLGGGDGRLEKAISLYKAGKTDYILLTRANERGTLEIDALEAGIPGDKIILEHNATSTYTNATNTKAILEDYQFRSAMIVTSDYHTRRTKLIFERVFKDSDINRTYIASESKHFRQDLWWGNMRSAQITIREYIGLVGYVFHLYNWIDLDPGNTYHSS